MSALLAVLAGAFFNCTILVQFTSERKAMPLPA